MTAPHSDRDHSGDPLERPFWPPGHRHAVETQQAEHEHQWTRRQNVTSKGYAMPGYDVCRECGTARPAVRPVNAESVARGQQQVIEAQRATLDAVRALRDEWRDKRDGSITSAEARRGLSDEADHRLYAHIMSKRLVELDAILDAAPNETKDQP